MSLLEELFGSRTRTRIIGLFTSRPGERFYLREISRLARCDVRAVKQELDRLERLGLVAGEASGNRRYFQVNQDFPLYPELKSMALKTLGLGRDSRTRLRKRTARKNDALYQVIGACKSGLAKGAVRHDRDIYGGNT